MELTNVIFAYFVPPLLSWRQTAEEWFTIVATIAMLLGGAAVLVIVLRRRTRMSAEAFEPDPEEAAS